MHTIRALGHRLSICPSCCIPFCMCVLIKFERVCACACAIKKKDAQMNCLRGASSVFVYPPSQQASYLPCMHDIACVCQSCNIVGTRIHAHGHGLWAYDTCTCMCMYVHVAFIHVLVCSLQAHGYISVLLAD